VTPSVSIKDQIVEGPLVMLNACLSLSWLNKSFRPWSRVAQLRLGTCSIEVCTLRGAECESKGRLGLNVLVASLSLGMWRGSYPRIEPELYQRWPKATMASEPRFVWGINTQLVVIDSNHCLSWIVRTWQSPLHRSNTCWNEMIMMDMNLLHRIWLLMFA
jgi:hypothetical protein